MSVYRITRFASTDMDKTSAALENLRGDIESAGADFIDIVSYENGKGVILAKYPDQAAMDNAASIARNVFKKLIDEGLVDGDSIHPHAGVVVNSF
ncbi:MAG: hypothetical protein ACI8P9_003689 [Parasphingorhabdus sp.]|jgi:hypothetical protein